jgi:hypothetical protein
MSAQIVRALIVREPWISVILEGGKTWEMRSKRANIRGRVGLIQQGTGAVVGVATLVDCLSPISREAYASYHQRHAIPPNMQEECVQRGWVIPWVLQATERLTAPVPYKAKSGQQDWVTLSAHEGEELGRCLLTP